jgi:hypothetical protein
MGTTVRMIDIFFTDGNSLGFQPSDGPPVVVLLYTSWNRITDDKQVYDANESTLEVIEQATKEKGTSASCQYLNYAFGH